MTAVTDTMLAMLAVAAAGSPSSAKPNALIGRWGGDHVILSISAEGGHLKLDCGAGDFAALPVPNKHGKFRIAGTLQFYRSGPTRADSNSAAAAAVYNGHIEGDRLTLDVTSSKTRDTTHYSLVRNRPTKLVRCM